MTFKELRRESGMTQQRFADFFGIPKRTIEDWDRGARECAPYLLDLMKYKLENEGFIDETKHGFWAIYKKDGVIHYKCPFCETIYAYIEQGHIAPCQCKKCGAKLDK